LQTVLTFFEQVLFLTQQMSVYLLAGFVVAGLLHVFIKKEWIHSQLGANSVGAVTKGVFLGAPLPLCSCGVIPVAASLKKAGASPAATLAFLIATPVTGVDSILATYALMGTFLATVRPVASIIIALCAGFILLLITRETTATEPAPPAPAAEKSQMSLAQRLVTALRYGLVELLSDIARPVTLGLLVGGAIAVFVPAHFIHQHVGAGPLAYGAMVLLATPLYVCATGSIPIAAALMAKGLSPGAALAFLLAGPATNTVTIAVAKDIIGKKGTVVYLLVIVVGTFLLAAGTDWLASGTAFSAPEVLAHQHHEEALGIVFRGAGWLLVGLLGYHLVAPFAQRLMARREDRRPLSPGRREVLLHAPLATCKNCTASIKGALGKLKVVDHVSVDLSTKLIKVTMTHEGQIADLQQALLEAGYESEPTE
jgi:uncharacterized protein